METGNFDGRSLSVEPHQAGLAEDLARVCDELNAQLGKHLHEQQTSIAVFQARVHQLELQQFRAPSPYAAVPGQVIPGQVNEDFAAFEGVKGPLGNNTGLHTSPQSPMPATLPPGDPRPLKVSGTVDGSEQKADPKDSQKRGHHHHGDHGFDDMVWDASFTLPSIAGKQMAMGDVLAKISNYPHWPHAVKAAMGQEKEPPRNGCLARFLSTSLFTNCIAMVIILNLPVMWWTAEYQLDNATSDKELPMALQVIEWVFLVIYTVELTMKLCVHGCYLFVGSDWAYNVLDFTLVITALLSQLLDTLNPSFLRALRILKMGKALRVLRILQVFPSLRLLVDCIANSLHVLMWSILMIVFMIYMFALVFVQGAISHMEEFATYDEIPEEVLQHFGSMGKTMNTLFKAVTGGDDWGAFYVVVEDFGPLYALAFLFYIIFNTIVIWNVVTSLFVDKAINLAQPDIETLIYEKSLQEKSDVEELIHLLETHFDTNGNKKLNLLEFTEALQDSKIRAFFEMRGLDIKNTRVFFDILASHGSDAGSCEVDLNHFAACCLRMKGPASSVDLHTLIVRQNRSMRQVLREELQRSALQDL